MDNDSKLCLIPFTALSVSPRGVIRACCNQMDVSMVKWDNIKDDADISWPTDTIKKLQSKMQYDNIMSATPECSRCWSQEALGVSSYRQHYQKIFNDTIDTDFEKYIENPKLKFLDVQFGYLCNLSCTMCAPSLSSNLQSTRMKMVQITEDEGQRQLYKRQLNIFDNLDWTKNDASYEKLKQLCSNITSIKLSGGEPFFNPKFKDFLKFLVTKETPIKFLHIVTNGTIYDPEIVELMNHIANVEFRFSLESTGREDQFIRWPTNWDEKISILYRYMDELKTSKYYANICLQSLNLFSFQNTIDYLKTLPHEIEVLHNVLAFTDMAALWHSDKGYIKHYLDSDIVKHPALEQHAKKALAFARSNHSMQSRYFKDSATIQNKYLEEEFPIWFKYHKQYLE